jgi:hypothetical protein
VAAISDAACTKILTSASSSLIRPEITIMCAPPSCSPARALLVAAADIVGVVAAVVPCDRLRRVSLLQAAAATAVLGVDRVLDGVLHALLSPDRLFCRLAKDRYMTSSTA